MLEAILPILSTMGYLGIIFGLLVLINTICGVIKNTSEGQQFSWKVFFKGIFKAAIFYGCSVLLSVAFTMLPEVNNMITNISGVQLIAQEILDTLSNVAVFTVVIGVIIAQGKSALEGLTQLLSVKVTNNLRGAGPDQSDEKRD